MTSHDIIHDEGWCMVDMTRSTWGKEEILELRAMELKHGRVAMLAVLGWFHVAAGYHIVPGWYSLSAGHQDTFNIFQLLLCWCWKWKGMDWQKMSIFMDSRTAVSCPLPGVPRWETMRLVNTWTTIHWSTWLRCLWAVSGRCSLPSCAWSGSPPMFLGWSGWSVGRIPTSLVDKLQVFTLVVASGPQPEVCKPPAEKPWDILGWTDIIIEAPWASWLVMNVMTNIDKYWATKCTRCNSWTYDKG